MAKKVTHHYPACIGCGACVGLAPQLFAFDHDTDRAQLIDGQLDETNSADPVTVRTVADDFIDDTSAQMTVASCPVQIINIENQN